MNRMKLGDLKAMNSDFPEEQIKLEGQRDLHLAGEKELDGLKAVSKDSPEGTDKARRTAKPSFGWKERSADRVVRIFGSLRGWGGHGYWVLVKFGGANNSTQVGLDDVGQEGFGASCACVDVKSNGEKRVWG